MSQKRISRSITAAVAGIALCGTAVAQDSSICRMEQVEGQKRLVPDFRKMVVITPDGDDADVFGNGRFSLSSTLAQILRTSVRIDPAASDANARLDAISSPDAQRELLSSLLRSFWETSRVDANGVVNNVNPRPNEATLSPDDVLKRMKPVGLFNRLDLAPSSFDFCGEHRIVYAMNTDGLAGFDEGPNRFLLIFEAAVNNPDRTNSPKGCLGIANFWKNLPSKTPEQRADALKAFYFQGDLGDNATKITPVIHNQHYGVPFGQIRGNIFITGGDIAGNPWTLREWRMQTIATGTRLVNDTVKSNPAPEFYSDSAIVADGSDHGRDQLFADLRPDFRKRFALSHVRELIDIDLGFDSAEQASQNSTALINGISALFDEKFNDFESISQPPAIDNIRQNVSVDLKKKIDEELAKYRLPNGWKLTADHIIARAEALSCGGCHQLTGNVEIAPGIVWPRPAGGFVHVTETGQLSPALEEQFLPGRCQSLHRFLFEHQAPAITPPIAATETPASDGTSVPAVGSASADVAKVLGAEAALMSLAAEVSAERPADAPATETDVVKAESDLKATVERARENLGRSGGAFRIGNRTH